MTNLVVSVLMLTNGVAAGAQELELRPVHQRICTNVCNACKHGWAPVEAPCTCKYADKGIAYYTVVPWVEPKKKGGAK